ncbi:uncharacterized protein L969DRAFT_96310 [Mixia osmundae IAM 14324]|uniref:Uncharacterized protein n=1 Tax=Mixia osmundae (strain CBS 9802 / IAM 14324 / JCM 22182 / KY 12970) TaxID=764103 RepID=G7E524_MIXOS|nr:uncharacterized protein L969DRAFT_96310 [Mixia osmundae IAM 14324]KEI37796.1 hypothetical protein L969DRAFT_96310 [Mixia osmundae IAM 14324]GAA97934.1 hypothetical protein E5Q_04614 [Mixia osmundae IAM 14324]
MSHKHTRAHGLGSSSQASHHRHQDEQKGCFESQLMHSRDGHVKRDATHLLLDDIILPRSTKRRKLPDCPGSVRPSRHQKQHRLTRTELGHCTCIFRPQPHRNVTTGSHKHAVAPHHPARPHISHSAGSSRPSHKHSKGSTKNNGSNGHRNGGHVSNSSIARPSATASSGSASGQSHPDRSGSQSGSNSPATGSAGSSAGRDGSAMTSESGSASNGNSSGSADASSSATTADAGGDSSGRNSGAGTGTGGSGNVNGSGGQSSDSGGSSASMAASELSSSTNPSNVGAAPGAASTGASGSGNAGNASAQASATANASGATGNTSTSTVTNSAAAASQSIASAISVAATGAFASNAPGSTSRPSILAPADTGVQDHTLVKALVPALVGSALVVALGVLAFLLLGARRRKKQQRISDASFGGATAAPAALGAYGAMSQTSGRETATGYPFFAQDPFSDRSPGEADGMSATSSFPMISTMGSHSPPMDSIEDESVATGQPTMERAVDFSGADTAGPARPAAGDQAWW